MIHHFYCRTNNFQCLGKTVRFRFFFLFSSIFHFVFLILSFSTTNILLFICRPIWTPKFYGGAFYQISNDPLEWIVVIWKAKDLKITFAMETQSNDGNKSNSTTRRQSRNEAKDHRHFDKKQQERKPAWRSSTGRESHSLWDDMEIRTYPRGKWRVNKIGYADLCLTQFFAFSFSLSLSFSLTKKPIHFGCLVARVISPTQTHCRFIDIALNNAWRNVALNFHSHFAIDDVLLMALLTEGIVSRKLRSSSVCCLVFRLSHFGRLTGMCVWAVGLIRMTFWANNFLPQSNNGIPFKSFWSSSLSLFQSLSLSFWRSTYAIHLQNE